MNIFPSICSCVVHTVKALVENTARILTPIESIFRRYICNSDDSQKKEARNRQITPVSLQMLFNDQDTYLSLLPKLGPCQMIQRYVFPIPMPGKIKKDLSTLRCVSAFEISCELRRIALDNEGNIFFVKFWNNNIQVWSKNGKFIQEIKAPNARSVDDVAIGPHGFIYALDTDHNCIHVFHENKTFLQTVTVHDSPRHIAIGLDGSIIVSGSYSGSGVYIYNPDGTLKKHISLPKEEYGGDFRHIRVQPTTGNFAVCVQNHIVHSNHQDIYFFQQDGTFLRKLEKAGQCVAFDGDGYFVTYQQYVGLRLFSPEGELVRMYDVPYKDLPLFVAGIAVDGDGRLVIGDYCGKKISFWQ